jgi:hypothetical protein
MKPFITICVPTYRPGGIDLLTESLRAQPPDLYELVIVDDYPGRVERGKVQEYIKSKGIPLLWYGKSKPHSYPRQKKCGLTNAMNTAIMHVRTPYIVFVSDYVWFLPGSIIQWFFSLNDCQPNTLISGIASMRNAEVPHCHDDISIWHGAEYPKCLWHIHDETEEWIPTHFESFHFGCYTSFYEQINGIDERADNGHISWNLWTLMKQAWEAKHHFHVDRRLKIIGINHRIWTNAIDEKDAKKLWHAEEGTKKEHPNFEPQLRSPNPFDLKAERLKFINEVGEL